MFRIIGKTDPGAVRDHNEDAFYCSNEQGFAVVADGMGGYAAGEVASEIIVKTLEELQPPADRLVAALVESHQRITAHAEAHPDSKGMGAAVVTAKLAAEQIHVCWAGDSRAYLFEPAGQLRPISRDHSYVQWLLSQGQISEEEARQHPDRNLVTQCLGLHPPQPELTRSNWESGDTLLLCSDGLTDELEDERIASILAQASDLESAADQLVAAANEAGGRDNITVVLARNCSSPKARAAEPTSSKQTVGGVRDRGAAQSVWLPVALGIGAAALLTLLTYTFWPR